MASYTCEFERIGRRRDVPPLDLLDVHDADEIAYHVYTYARRFLASRDVTVTALLDEMRGTINGGRFGTFSIKPMEPPALELRVK